MILYLIPLSREYRVYLPKYSMTKLMEVVVFVMASNFIMLGWHNLIILNFYYFFNHLASLRGASLHIEFMFLI